jgi:hypothetical protein
MMMLTRCGNCTHRDTPVVVAIVRSTSTACIRVVGNYPDCGEAFAAVNFSGDGAVCGSGGTLSSSSSSGRSVMVHVQCSMFMPCVLWPALVLV